MYGFGLRGDTPLIGLVLMKANLAYLSNYGDSKVRDIDTEDGNFELFDR
jgi:hypothetical protein